jgi:hypothetical protein
MSVFTTAIPSSASLSTGAFWERLWRMSGIISVALFIAAYLVYGHQPQVGASAETLAAFYDRDRTRILVAAVLSGNAILFLLWFAAALRATLADAGQDGWGAAATASSAVVGGLSLLLTSVGAALAYATAGSGNVLASGLNDFAWAGAVLTSFPRAMLIMAGTFGLWRSGLISNVLFGAGVTAVVLGVLGGTTWLSGGFWAPDGAYTRFIFPIVCLGWIVVVSRVLLSRKPAARTAW